MSRPSLLWTNIWAGTPATLPEPPFPADGPHHRWRILDRDYLRIHGSFKPVPLVHLLECATCRARMTQVMEGRGYRRETRKWAARDQNVPSCPEFRDRVLCHRVVSAVMST
jgi:hypothetical protein